MECDHQRGHDANREQQAAGTLGQSRRHNRDFTARAGAGAAKKEGKAKWTVTRERGLPGL